MEVENSIFASPLNPKVLLLSTRLLPSGSTTRTSQNAGKAGSWGNYQELETNGLSPVSLIGKHAGGTSGNGKFYVNYLGPNGQIGRDVKVVIKLETSNPWDAPVTILDAGLNPDGQGGLQNHIWIDNTSGSAFEDRVYCGWSEDTGPRVLMKRSINDGATWIPPLDQVPTFVDAQEGPRWNLGINLHSGDAPAGRLYAGFSIANNQPDPAMGIGFRISLFGGESWQSACPTPCSRPTPTTCDCNPPLSELTRQKILDINGLPSDYLCSRGKTMKVNSYPSMAVVRTLPPHDNPSVVLGNIFIVYAAKTANTPSAETDIYVIKSTDGGDNWSTPLRVNQDPLGNNKDQWHPWISWDDCTGALVVVFYDSRDFAANEGVNTYMAVSYPPRPAHPNFPQEIAAVGDSWTDFKVSDVSWSGDPPGASCGQPGFAGDHIGVAARDGMAFAVWSDDRNQTQGTYKPFVSPVYLWGVKQETVTLKRRQQPRNDDHRHRGLADGSSRPGGGPSRVDRSFRAPVHGRLRVL